MGPLLHAQKYLEGVRHSGLLTSDPDLSQSVSMSQYLTAVLLLQKVKNMCVVLLDKYREIQSYNSGLGQIVRSDQEWSERKWKRVGDLIEQEVGLPHGSLPDAVCEGVLVLVNKLRKSRGEDPLTPAPQFKFTKREVVDETVEPDTTGETD